MDVVIHFLWLIGGLALLYYGADWLVDGASRIALKLGISPLVVGLTVVAFGTSMPELLVCLKANSPELLVKPAEWLGVKFVTKGGSSDIALGNIVGSNIFNVALILGVAALIRPVVIHSQLIRREMPILILCSAVFLMMMADMVIQQWEGWVLIAGILFYVVSSVLLAKRAKNTKEFETEYDESDLVGWKAKMWCNLALCLVGILALVLGAHLLVDHGEALARIFGVPEVIISLTLFALGTSLPELATTVVASLKKQGDIITGNAIGSCIFNLMAVMGVTAGVEKLEGKHIAWLDLGVMMGVTLLIMPFMWTNMRLGRREGAVMVTIALVYSVMVVMMQR
ncbi:sodium:calcium antiporter [Oceaniferula marina]|uniref:sodium:calcium antiporter n=1 Tax=Oceaniferula marina TaxID=2748318 RepID=UPI0029CA1DB3|nr:sodium:calcium antiporter [Oceaniferula marina]